MSCDALVVRHPSDRIVQLLAADLASSPVSHPPKVAVHVSTWVSNIRFTYIFGSGRADVSKDGKNIVVSNLTDGFDQYSAHTQSLVRTFQVSLPVNVPLPLCFVHDGLQLHTP